MRIPSLIAILALAISPTFAAETAATSTIPAAELPTVDHLVYLSELPDPADLIKDAAANGLTIKRVDRTSDRIVVTYAYPDGQISTLGYALLTAARSSDRVAVNPVQQDQGRDDRTYIEVSPEPEIVYVEPHYRRTRIVYRDRMDDVWLPLSLGIGIGWIANHHGGYYGHGHISRGRRH
jgi:hypothetical protein